jgi:O-antigen/teichoic acid export membrane protein
MKTEELFKYLKKSFFTGSAKTIVVSVVTLIFLPLIINQIGMGKYGLVAMTMMFGGAVIIVDFGISKTITLLLGKTEAIKEKNEIVADAFLITTSILVIAGIVFFSLIFFKVPILGNALSISHELKNYIIFSGFMTLAIMMVNNLCTAILESYLLMHYVNVGFGLSSIGFHLILFLAGLLFNSDFILVSTPFISYAIVTVYYLALIHKKTDLKLVKPSIGRAKKIMPISIKFLGLSLVSSLAMPVNKYILLLLSGNPVIIGIYDLGLKIAFMANSFLNSIAQPLFGVFTKFKEDKIQAFVIAKKVSFIILCMYLVGIFSYFVGEFITEIIDPDNGYLLFTTSFMLVAFISYTSISEPFYRAFIGLSYLKKAMTFKLFAIIFNILLYFVFYQYEPLIRVILSHGLSSVIASSLIIIGGLSFKLKTIESK